MSRINTNVNSLIAQRVLGQQNNTLTKTLERLSTGYKINRGADGPAGLIASEKLRSEKVSLSAALGNAERADQVVNIAEGGLQEISSLLLDVQSLVSQSTSEAGLSDDEKAANQQQIDSILQTIDRISSTTSFQGTKLLNGNYDFTVSGVGAGVTDFQVNGAKIADETTGLSVKAIVTLSAQHAGAFLSAGGALNLTANSSTFVFELAGSKGTRQFSFSSGTALSEVATSINSFKSVTGVSAKASGTGIVLKSTEYGSDQFVSVKIVDDAGQAGGIHLLSGINENAAKTAAATTFAAAIAPVRDEGQDVQGSINGITAAGNGRTLSVNNDALEVSVTLSAGWANVATTRTLMTVTGGGATFNLGPSADIANQVRLGIPNVAARNLGNVTDGYLSSLGSGQDNNVVNGDTEQAKLVVNNAIDQVTKLRGRLGSFQSNVVQSTIRALGVAYENTSAAESVIRDTDFAAETANLTRSQILVAAASSSLALSNSNPNNVLRLLQ